jgi:hypothetical protein
MLVGRFALQLAELRPVQRMPAVYSALGQLRAAYRDAHSRDRTAVLHCDNFVDTLEAWIWRTVRVIDQQDERPKEEVRPAAAPPHLVPHDYRQRAQQCREQAARAVRQEHQAAWRQRAEYWDGLTLSCA